MLGKQAASTRQMSVGKPQPNLLASERSVGVTESSSVFIDTDFSKPAQSPAVNSSPCKPVEQDAFSAPIAYS